MLEALKTLVKRAVTTELRRRDACARRPLGTAFNGLPPELWGYALDASGDLAVQGVAVAELARQFGSPLHIVNMARLRENYRSFIGAMRQVWPATKLATSYKTNPVPAVLRTLHDLGTDAEVISEFELWLAQHIGLSGERIIVNGPAKSDAMLERAVAMNVRLVNIDGFGEIDAVARAAERRSRIQPVGLRVVTSVGWTAQFGVPLADGSALAAFERIAAHRWLKPAGIHLHLGTGLKSVALYARAIAEVLEFSAILRSRLGIDIAVFDLGGGFGVPTVRGMDGWDLRMIALGDPAREALPSQCPTPEEFARAIGSLFRTRFGTSSAPEIVLEPGRAITSSAQTLVLRVVAVKDSGNSHGLILDGGKNLTLPLGWECHKIFAVRQPGRAGTTRTTLYGPLCHPGDVLASHLELPRLEIGDHVAIMDAGAYFIPNQLNFSNPRPAIITVDEGRARLVRRRESFDDLVRLDEPG